MRRLSLLARFLSPLLAVTIVACVSGPGAPDDSASVKEIQAVRAEKDRSWSQDPDSPVPPDKRAKILPLKYYAIDEAYSAPASLKLYDDRQVIEMPTSTGTPRKMERVGQLQFALMGQPLTLDAFVEDGTQQITQLFVPFADQTTGTETYGAGRYLDLKPTSTGFYIVDFNRAYNPTCAYNPTWECPYPPPSNRLKIAIRAGEKAPPEEPAAKTALR